MTKMGSASLDQPPSAVPPVNLVTMFETAVSVHPDQIALRCDAQGLTYRELDGRANQLAHHLIHEGVRPGHLVGISLERSMDLVIGLIAILKTGAAYVPLDPTYPADRLSFMVEDASPKLVLCNGTAVGRWRSIDMGAEAVKSHPTRAPAVSIEPRSLAYVIYTSGSTGRPKGAMITHHNVVRLFTSIDPWFGFGPRDVWSLFHSCSFDFSVFEIWGALAYGGTLVIVPYSVSRSPIDFYALLATEGVTMLSQTPSAFRQLIRAVEADPGRADELRLRAIVFGGEKLEFASLKPWVARFGLESPRLINMYGITETTVHVTYREVGREDLDRTESLIGVPIPDLTMHVLGDDGRPVQPGMVGELYVGGAGVAVGYLNRSDLTAERFLPDTCSPDPTARLYRTGDLVRRSRERDYEYLGRADAQVKVRGFRIELGEIEAALAQHPDVREALVTLRKDAGGEDHLVAYVSAARDTEIGARKLRPFLLTRLPDYMVPSSYVVLDSLPLTSNGKVNRKDLPSFSFSNEPIAGVAAAMTTTEKVIAAIWEEILELPQAGIDDNFFDIGGSSLRLARVHERLRHASWSSLSIMDLFAAPTIRTLAERLDHGSGPRLSQARTQADKQRAALARLERRR